MDHILGGQKCARISPTYSAPACPNGARRIPNGARRIHVNDIRSEPGNTRLSQDDGSIHKANSLKLIINY